MSTGPTDIIAPATAKTIPGLFRERVTRSPDAVAYREWDSISGRWSEISWRNMARLVGRYHAALGRAGLTNGDGAVQWSRSVMAAALIVAFRGPGARRHC